MEKKDKIEKLKMTKLLKRWNREPYDDDDDDTNDDEDEETDEDEDEEYGEKCGICFKKKKKITFETTTDCGHCFHDSCFFEWLLKSPTCPFCRSMQNILHN